MNITKKILLLLLAISLPLSASAAIQSDQLTDPTALQLNGYSPESIRLIRMQKNKIDGKVVDQKYQPKQKPDAQLLHPTTWFRSFIFQIDPAEQGDDFGAQTVDSL